MPPAKNSNKQTSIDSPERRRLPPLLRKSWYGLNQAFRRRLAPLRITPDQFTVLRTLTEAEARGLTQRELTDRISSDPNTVASLLERMCAARLLERASHEDDRRAHRIRLLELGEKTYLAARAVAIKLQSEVLHALPAKNRARFLEDLEHVALACKSAAELSPKTRLKT